MREVDTYQGVYVKALKQTKERKKKWTHPIFLYSPESTDELGECFERLDQIVNVYEHSLEDFEFNSLKIVEHYRNNYGNTTLGLYTLGQSIRFRVYKGQDPIDLSLFSFFMNYTMLILPIQLKVDMTKWVPWNPQMWTSGAWEDQMNRYITQCRIYGNNRRIGELVGWSKYLMNMFVATAGDRMGLSISNNDFIEVAHRSKDAYESLSCTFDIPKNIEPSQLEAMVSRRTTDLLNFISEQTDLPISVYTRNGLFNPGQFKEFAVHIGYKPDLYGNTIPFTSNTNIIKGLKDPKAYTIDAYGGRKAEIIKLNVSDAGAFERSLCMLMSSVRFVDLDYECDSRHFRKRKIDSMNTLGKLDGRVCTLDPKSDEYLIIDPDNTKLIGKTVYLKTPITCTHPRRKEGYICSACYGKLMSNLNCDIHIGRISALNNADDMEQTLLSAKHALATNTNEVKFDSIFNTYFDMGSCQIYFNQAMIDMSADDEDEFNHLWLEFNMSTIKKRQDGEGRHYDRSFPEIIVYDDRDENRIVIQEENNSEIYFSPEFNEYFLAAIKHKDEKDKGTVRIPFSDLIDTGKVTCDILFEYQYKNNELAAAVLELDSILNKGVSINSFKDYDECLDKIIPLFVAGGIHLPEFQQEMMVSQMIYRPDGSPVDWTEEDPEYQFFSIDKSIQNNASAITSILYHESSMQLGGAYGTFEKTGTSAYDYFLYDNKE